MKIIKNINNLFFLLVIITSSTFSQTQNANNTEYIGIWEYQNGNQIFRLFIWKDTVPNSYDNQYYLKGNYKMIEKNNDDTETIIYSSNPKGEQNSDALNGLVHLDVYSGIFHQLHDNSFDIIGNFEIAYFLSSEISFNVSIMNGINIQTIQEEDFEIPNHIMLIKKP